MVILQALILYGHKVPDTKLNTSPETIFKGISFTRLEETVSSGQVFLKTEGGIRNKTNTVLEVL